jgi:hypothetical protein
VSTVSGSLPVALTVAAVLIDDLSEAGSMFYAQIHKIKNGNLRGPIAGL